MQEQAQTVDVSVFTAEMARGVPVEILRVDIDLFAEQRLDYTEVTSDASDMEWRSEILRSAVNVSTELCKELNQVHVSLV